MTNTKMKTPMDVTADMAQEIVKLRDEKRQLVGALRRQCARWEELEKLHSGSDGWKPAEGRALLRSLREME